MKKQLVALGIIGILIAISISGCLEDNKENNGSIITPTTHLSGKVTVTTNKIEYRQNETINITLCNGLNVSIYSYITGAPQDYLIEQVEKKTSEGWLAYRPFHIESYVAYMSEVKSGQSVSFEWEPLVWMNETFNYSKLKSGIYRIKTGYNLSENDTWETVYSNEFYVEKEQIQDVIVTTNKIEYKQNETVNITMFNGLNVSIFSLAASQSAVFSIESIEKKIFGGWQSFFAMGQWPECDYDFDFAAEIKSGESVSFDWKPLIWISGCDNFTQAEPGVYRLLIDSVYSNEFTITEDNDSTNHKPTALFNYTPIENINTSTEIQFNDISTTCETVFACVITDRLWTFGDGNTSNEKNPIHIYETAGNYTVTLWVKNGFDEEDISDESIIEVTESI